MSKLETTTDPLLAEQIAYYRAIAPEYEDHAIAQPGARELTAALNAFPVNGHVLELACGPGAWTAKGPRRSAAG
jgi:demethylmenaquinone methyltransferase/2-methoxy-6-polyprenyl-1,4-benzoquinol methylase